MAGSSTAFPRLLSPLTIGHTTLKNRIVFQPVPMLTTPQLSVCHVCQPPVLLIERLPVKAAPFSLKLHVLPLLGVA